MDIPILALVWFILIAVLWIGYLVLEGFDFGVGILLRPLARDEKERRVLINTIGPVWDGNEVWLLVAGGATFAAFPEWYATMFSGFYLPLLLILAALIIRGVAFEYRGKIDDDRWRNRWDWAATVGSWIPAILWGVAFANLVRGVELTEDHQMVSSFFDLLSPFALLGGLATLALFLTNGSIFIALKTSGEIQQRAMTLAARFAIGTTVIAGVWGIWAQLAHSDHTLTWIPLLLAAGSLVAVVVFTHRRREGWAFVFNALAIALVVVFIFGTLFPNVMPAINDPAHSLTIAGAASSHLTLVIMTWVAVIMTPIVLIYQSYTYWVFRRRIGTDDIPPPTGLKWTQRPASGRSKAPESVSAASRGKAPEDPKAPLNE